MIVVAYVNHVLLYDEPNGREPPVLATGRSMTPTVVRTELPGRTLLIAKVRLYEVDQASAPVTREKSIRHKRRRWERRKEVGRTAARSKDGARRSVKRGRVVDVLRNESADHEVEGLLLKLEGGTRNVLVARLVAGGRLLELFRGRIDHEVPQAELLDLRKREDGVRAAPEVADRADGVLAHDSTHERYEDVTNLAGEDIRRGRVVLPPHQPESTRGRSVAALVETLRRAVQPPAASYDLVRS